ncbi:MAG: tetratricopeptide repeat protein [bacterium]
MTEKLPQEKHRNRFNYFIIAFISLAIVFIAADAYRNSPGYGFVYDDYELVVRNADIRDLSSAGIAGMFFSRDYVNFLPLRMLSYAVDYHYWGLNPKGYHITNVIMHAVNCLLVFMLALYLIKHVARREWDDRIMIGAAGIAALFFAAHPIHVEAVAWVSGRKEMLYSFFILLGMLFYVRSRTIGATERANGGFAVVWLCFIAAMMSKGTALVFPFVLVFFDIMFPEIAKRTPLVRRLQEHAAFFMIMVVFLAIDAKSAYRGQMFTAPFGGGALSHILTIAKVVPFYLKQIFWPANLSAIYIVPVAHSLFEPAVLISLAVWAGLGALFIFGRRRWPLIVFGAGFFLIALGPTLNVVPFGTFAADRYAYLPLFGLCLAAGDCVGLAKQRGAAIRILAGLVIIAAFSACFYITEIKNADWKDSITFWTATARTAPDSTIAAAGLGAAYMEKGEFAKALPELERALKLDPDSPTAYSALALYYLSFNDTKKAESVIREGLKRMPGNLALLYHSGIVHYKEGDYERAAWIFAGVYATKPNYLNVGNKMNETIGKLKKTMTPSEFEEFSKSFEAVIMRQ